MKPQKLVFFLEKGFMDKKASLERGLSGEARVSPRGHSIGL